MQHYYTVMLGDLFIMAQKKVSTADGCIALTVFLLMVSQFVARISDAQAIEEAPQQEQELLREVFPEADVFSSKSGKLPHYKAYAHRKEAGLNELLGFVFMTNEVEPEEWAYSSEIEALVGLTTDGIITKVKMIDHFEPFGYFSIDPPEFVEQFTGKSILDPFEEGRDIDAVTRATITVEGAARVIRKAARQIVRQHLANQKRAEE